MHNARAEAIAENHVTLGCFEVGGHTYAIDVAQVREVVRWQSVTPLPNAPALIEGVIDLRGAVVPVVDLGRALGGAPVAPGLRTRIAVTEVDGLVMGLAVDAAVEVLSVDVGPSRRSADARHPDRLRHDARRGPPPGRRADPRAVARARAGERLSLRALRAGGRRMTHSALPTGRGLMWRMHALTVLDPAARARRPARVPVHAARAHARAVAVVPRRGGHLHGRLHGADHALSAALGGRDRRLARPPGRARPAAARRCTRPSPRACASRFAAP